jgi:hypothetical protein
MTEKELHLSWLQELSDAQEADRDMREQARDSDSFLLDKDGQWEDDVSRVLDSQKRPRYTFDQVTPAIEILMADIEDMDFASNIRPHGGQANKDDALVFEGMIRTIENESNASDMYRQAVRRLMRRGFDAWCVKSDYSDSESFDQDLIIKQIPNAINRVWVDPTAKEEDSSDSEYSYILTSLSPVKYKEQFPDGDMVSVEAGDFDDTWEEYQPEVVVVGERYYKKQVDKEIAQMSNGEVIELTEDSQKIIDELALAGITITRTKTAKVDVFYHRFFDGGGFLSKERQTIFKSNPVVTVYGNFELIGEASKRTYSGVVQKLMDYQRVLNYSKSREIEEGALAPREKLLMTKKQAKGNEKQLASMNVSADPVLFYNPDGEAPQPYKLGGAQVNPHLTTTANDMSAGIQISSGINNAMSGQHAARMSEDSLRMQIDRGTGSTRKWVNALIRGIRRTSQILLEAIPTTYDTKRQYALTNIDGTEDVVTLNDEIYDQQSQSMVKVNWLSAGKYKVYCDAGPAFNNRLEAGREALLAYAQIDPTITQMAGDVLLRSIDAPYVDKIADRKRQQMLQQGLIPFDQMTDEEKEQLQQQMMANQQNQQPDANMVLAMAEQQKAQADMVDAQTSAREAEIKAFEAETRRQKIQVDAAEAGVNIENKQADTIGKHLDNAAKQAEQQIKSMSTDELLRIVKQ